MTRKQAKKMAQSRDCSCVKGKDRDSNYNECVDIIFDYHENIIKTMDAHDVRLILIAYEESKHKFLSKKYRHEYAVKLVDEFLGKKDLTPIITNNMLDLHELEEQIDKTLEKETSETLTNFLKKKR